MFHQDNSSFVFHPGPVFSNVVLADEINRAAPRTQSALLEVMEERQVTVDGRPYPVPRPFLVMATQNPVEMDGTYPLPEAQLDRFLIKTDVGYPDHAAEVRVLQSEHGGAHVEDVPQVSDPDEIAAPDRRRAHRARRARDLRLHRLAGRPHPPDAAAPAGSVAARRAGSAAGGSGAGGTGRPPLRRARGRAGARRSGARAPDAGLLGVRGLGRHRRRRGAEAVAVACPAGRRAAMTRRGGALLLAAAALAGVGVAGALARALGGRRRDHPRRLVLLVALRPAPRGTVGVDQSSVRVVRGQPAAVTVSLDVQGRAAGPGRRGGAGAPRDVALRLRRALTSFGCPSTPRSAVSVRSGPTPSCTATPGGSYAGCVPARGRHPDGAAPHLPGTPVGDGRVRAGDSDCASRRSGDQHFHALRDYVLGDEPRSVHWRSSARAGKLVVRQQVSAASEPAPPSCSTWTAPPTGPARVRRALGRRAVRVGGRGGCLASRSLSRAPSRSTW